MLRAPCRSAVLCILLLLLLLFFLLFFFHWSDRLLLNSSLLRSRVTAFLAAWGWPNILCTWTPSFLISHNLIDHACAHCWKLVVEASTTNRHDKHIFSSRILLYETKLL